MRFAFSFFGALVAIIMMWTGPAASQSFNCDKAQTATEKKICDSGLLSTLDMMMADVYRTVRSVSSQSSADELQAAQRTWLKQRDACGTKTGCLKKSYIERIDTIWKGQETLADWPGIYNGPYGENEIEVRQTPSGGLEFHLLGGSSNYICDYGPAVGRIKGEIATINFDGSKLRLRRLGKGFYLPANPNNTKTIQSYCGARAPDLMGWPFTPEGASTPAGRSG